MKATEKEAIQVEVRNPEKIIVFVYTVYVAVLMFAAVAIGWPAWINPIALMGILSVWIVYLKEVRDYKFRALLYSAVALATFAIYNTLETSFEGILTTYCAIVVALSILNVPEVVGLEYLFSTFLIVFHGVFQNNIPIATTHERVLSAAQILAVFIVTGTTHFLIKKRQKKAQKLLDTIEELKAAEQSKLDFIAHVSRQIVIPVSDICSFTEEALKEELSDDVRKGAMHIHSEGKALMYTINDVLDFSEMESGKLALKEEVYHPAEVFNNVVMKTLSDIGNKDIELIVDCDAKIPAALVGDEEKIRRAMMCLTDNAVKFTESGSITISVAAREEEYGINLFVKVKDTGVGMTPEELEKVFSAFHQVDAEKNRKSGSIGIGLAISKKIVDKMNGFINAKSEPGRGSEFQFVVPQKVADEHPMAAVRNAEGINIIYYINAAKPSFLMTRDDYMSSITHMMESLDLRYQRCRSLEEFKRRNQREIFTHALIMQEEYLEDTAYFDELSQEVEIIMLQNNQDPVTPSGSIKPIGKPFCAFALSSVLNGEYEAMLQMRKAMAALYSIEPPEMKKKKKTHICREKGIQLMGGNARHYQSILQAYLSEGNEKISTIGELFAAEDWENYVIYVHAVKSNSFGIGADELGEMAKGLEMAGKENNIEYIKAHHDEMIMLYREVLSEISGGNSGLPDEGRDH